VNRRAFETLAGHYGAASMIETLRPFVSEQRQARIEAVLLGRLRGVEVAIEQPYDPHNAAAVVRSAEALGAWAVHVIAASERILRAPGTTKGTHNWIDTRHHRSLDAFVTTQRDADVLLVGACVDATHTLDDLPTQSANGGPICLLFGNEHAGLSAEAQAACEVRFRIPIYGFAESYNLSVAAALTLYATTRRIRARLGADGDLDEAGRELERARCYFLSIDERHARALFPTPAADRG
jgi:tRNA (guanosine-2'-O-)-methyltransferase